MSNRIRRVTISSWLFAEMLKDGHESHVKCVNGLPADAKFVRLIDGATYGIDMVFSSETFDALKDGDEIPRHEVLFETLSHLCAGYKAKALKQDQ